ncbi:hypothetical protein [Chryseobacterium hispalense]|uniref:hypothetical protein n=1 Tax=Chryseobacterium hispalense TaxID=1453492 RepID=UPI00391C5506
MKKQKQKEKQLSLKKVQIMKISDLKKITGGNSNQNFIGNGDPTDPTIRQTMGQK